MNVSLRICLVIAAIGCCGAFGVAADAPSTPPGDFDATISRETLRAYLSRSITMMDLLTGRGDLADDIRMLQSTRAKLAGRTLFVWGGENTLAIKLEMARQRAAEIHRALPDILLEACIFEIVTRQVNDVAAPAWAFEALGRSVEKRNFRFDDMRYADGQLLDQWGKGTAVPDVSRAETQLWFYFLGKSYIDAGCEAIHFGQVELMDRNDRGLDHYASVFEHIRAYAKEHARRHIVLCDAHVPSGGLVRNGGLLLDFHAFPLRLVEISSKPQEAELRVGFQDSFYGRSKGGVTPSGWSCAHLPYIVELDNWGASEHPGQAGLGGIWTFGYDEITWFAHQPEQYRNDWLRYAWRWVRDHDADGYLQMPGSRVLATAVDGKDWYFANAPSAAMPTGFDQEGTIKAIWATDGKR